MLRICRWESAQDAHAAMNDLLPGVRFASPGFPKGVMRIRSLLAAKDPAVLDILYIFGCAFR